MASTLMTVWLSAPTSLTAIGGWFGAGDTVTVTKADAVPPRPSLIVYAKRSMPLKPVAGVYSTALPEITVLPLIGGVTLCTTSVSPSGSVSLPRTAKVTGVSSLVLAVSGLATGPSLVPTTVMVTVVGVPSMLWTVKVSVWVSPSFRA